MTQTMRGLLFAMALAPGVALADDGKSHEQLTAETRALMEQYFAIHQANDFTIDEFIKFYHEDLRATYYRPTGIFTFTSAQQYYDTYKPERLTTFDFDYKPWTVSLLMLVDGENAVTRYVAHARTKDGEYRNHYIHMYRVRGGKIVEFHAITNPHSRAHYPRNRKFLHDLGLYKGQDQP
ncbi:MAG: nuclear transport factor 2 family protein [Gammaproteobacteria bacterium]|nr:nuclear transport factor 2 family protein [Gammaproteobacteria bacterium]